jgi:hypothetical protein
MQAQFAANVVGVRIRGALADHQLLRNAWQSRFASAREPSVKRFRCTGGRLGPLLERFMVGPLMAWLTKLCASNLKRLAETEYAALSPNPPGRPE